jgi:hypothetical protein
LVVTERTVTELKTNKVSKEANYWVANKKRTAENEKELIFLTNKLFMNIPCLLIYLWLYTQTKDVLLKDPD